MITIKKYNDTYWDDICAAHDGARKIELENAGLEAAFLPLSKAAKSEGLFDYEHLDVAVEGAKAIGFCAYSREELAWLYVLPEKMRCGIGRRLVEHALSEEPGIYYIEVLFGNEPAKKLYESFGFSVAEVLEGKMPGNESFGVKVLAMKRKVL